MNVRLRTKSIGIGRWRDIWVSKSDVVEFLRCPFRVFVAYSKNIPMDELKKPEMIMALLEMGSRFENSVISRIQFKEAESIESVFWMSM